MMNDGQRPSGENPEDETRPAQPNLRRRRFTIEMTSTDEQFEGLVDAFLHVADLIDPGEVDMSAEPAEEERLTEVEALCSILQALDLKPIIYLPGGTRQYRSRGYLTPEQQRVLERALEHNLEGQQ